MAAKHIPISKRDNKRGINKHTAISLNQRVKKRIENDVYHIFKSIEGDEIKVADLLLKLDMNPFKQSYRKIKFPYEGLLWAILLMRIKHIGCFSHLESYLENHKRERRKLGMKSVPNRRTLSYFVNHVLTDETKALLAFTANKIVQIADKLGFDLDYELPITKPKKTPQSTIYVTVNKKTKELVKTLKKRISPFIEINMNGNCVYNKSDFLDLLIHMALTQDFAENGSKTLKELRKAVPDADALLYHLKKYHSIEELQRIFYVIFEKLWDMARRQNLFNPYRKFDIAIDFTEWYFYGDKGAPMVVGKKPERGTDRCYRFATVNIVEADRRFTLLALPVGPFDNTDEILSQLIHYAKQRIKVRKVYTDRGFFNGKCIRVFNKNHVHFLMPCTAYSTVIHLLKITAAPCVVKDFRVADIPINMVIIEKESKKYAFASNEEWDENDIDLANRISEQYRKRWGIETSYRVKKYAFRSKTTSKNYYIRLFYFMFSVLMYNLWILLDIILCLVLFGQKQAEHVVTSKLFGTIFYKTRVE